MRESKTQASGEGDCGVARLEVLRDAKPEWLMEQGVVSLQESWPAYHSPGGAPRVVE
jgi:hypothetical protein